MKSFIGHKSIIDRFYKGLEKGALSHAHIIAGEDGIGKSILAKDFAVHIIGKEKIMDYVDIIEYKQKGNSIGVEDIRSINEEIYKKPYEGDKKVIIIHNGNNITIQGQNALLKSIEEPPKGVFLIILCESLEQILDTIKSRCQIHKLYSLSYEEINLYIDNKYKDLEDSKRKAAIAYSEGIPGKIDKFLNEKELSDIRNVVINFLKDSRSRDKSLVIKYVDALSKYKNKWEEILHIMTSYIRDVMLIKEVENSDLIINTDKLDEIQQLSNLMSFKNLNAMLDIINETRGYMISNTNFGMTISSMLISIMEV